MRRKIFTLTLAALTVGLLGSCSKINERIDDLDKRVSGLQSNEIATINQQIANINTGIADLAAIRQNVQNLTEGTGPGAAKMKEADEALGKRIDDLKDYVKKLETSTDWLESTFVTIDEYKKTSETVAKIKKEIGEDVNLKNWINEQLKGYCSIAKMEAGLAEMDSSVDSVRAEVAKMKTTIDAEYKEAIRVAIEESEGRLTAELETRIATVNGRIDALETAVAALTDRVFALEGMIQSIEYVPEGSDRTITVTYNDQSGSISINKTTTFHDFTIKYRVTPASALDAIFNADDTPQNRFKLYFKGVSLVETRAGEPDNRIAIDTVMRDQFDKELITVVVSKDELNRLPVRNCISDHTTLSLALGCENGATDFVGAYTDVRFEDYIGAFKRDYEDVYLQMARLIGSKQPGTNYNPYRVLFNMCADDVIVPNDNLDDPIVQLNNFSYDASNEVVYYCYTNFYKAIDVCNKFIHKYFPTDGVSYENNLVDEIEHNEQYLAEVRTLRAWLHFTLATGWNNPPLVTEYPAPANPENCAYSQLLSWCERELRDVDTSLSERQNQDDKEGAYIVTKHFAKALRVKVALFNNFNGQDEEGTNLFTKSDAVNAINDVINSDKYDLNGDYSDLYSSKQNGNKEKIFELNMEKFAGPGYVDAAAVPYMGMETDLWGWKGNAFTKNALNDFYSSSGGLVQGAGLCGIPESFPYSEYGDPRFGSYIAAIQDYGSDSLKTAGLYGQYKYYSLKQIICGDDINRATENRVTNFTIMRLEEVYYLQSELAGDQTRMNKIEAARGLPEVPSYTLENLKIAKERELWMEGCRWPDIVRWNDTDAFSRLGNAGKDIPVLYDKLTREPADGETPEYVDDGAGRFYVIKTNKAQEAGKTVGFTAKHKYFPYPAAVVAENSNIVQNTGW